MADPEPPQPALGGATEVLLLRHAATSWNDQQRRLGWADHPLTAAGRAAAQAWGRESRLQFAAVVASDLRRARETANVIAAGGGLDRPVELAGLREQDQGVWTGMTKAEIKARWPERFHERPRRPVGGEAPEVVLARVLATLAEVAKAHPGRRVLAITHSQVIRILERALGAPASPVPHLAGRWVTVIAPTDRGGDPSPPAIHPGAPTAGRRPVSTDRPGLGPIAVSGR